MVAHITIQILDRSVAVMQIKEHNLQLAGGAAFWIAAKMEGIDSSKSKFNASKMKSQISLKLTKITYFRGNT